MELEGKVVVITGAGGNIGAACARDAAAEGARVIASDRPGMPVDQVVDEIRAAGGQAVVHEGDLLDETAVVTMIATAMDSYGRLDGLVNVAGATDGSRQDADLLTMETEFWDRVMAVNARGPVLTCKHALPIMLAAGSGSIVNFTSPAGVRGDKGLFAYSSSKAAVIGFTQCVATTYGRRGIRCNAVAPGCVWGDRIRESIGPDRLARFASTRLTPRLGVPEDAAHMVTFLLSDKSSFVTAQTLAVDGGGTKYQPWAELDSVT
jgi:NAD(P)-dependent dehydrogenase (short-subunit alcohol dehydrogenase family)